MVGTNHESQFSVENYEDFYAHHKFEPISDDDYARVHELIPRFGWAYDVVDEIKPQTLLDLGCLDGSFALTISKELGVAVYGVDLTEDGVAIANERAKKDGLDAEFFNGTIEEYLTMFAENGMKFDVVTCFEVLEHVKAPEELLKQIDTVLAPGGTVLISTPDFESPLYGKDDEKNKCHIRLYTTADEDYDAVNKYGNTRTATSITKQIGKGRIKEIGVYSHLINVRYE